MRPTNRQVGQVQIAEEYTDLVGVQEAASNPGENIMGKKKSSGQPTMQPVTSAIFPPRRDFTFLSIKDLLGAREAYHVYLASLENVVAPAIGR